MAIINYCLHRHDTLNTSLVAFCLLTFYLLLLGQMIIYWRLVYECLPINQAHLTRITLQNIDMLAT